MTETKTTRDSVREIYPNSYAFNERNLTYIRAGSLRMRLCMACEQITKSKLGPNNIIGIGVTEEEAWGIALFIIKIIARKPSDNIKMLSEEKEGNFDPSADYMY